MSSIKSYSVYQEGIFQFGENGSGHGVVEAAAGSGKTSTLVELARRLTNKYPIANILFLAFNKHIADELSTRLAGTNASARTIHSAGNQAVGTIVKGAKIEGRKYNKLCEKWVDRNASKFAPDERMEIASVLAKLVNFARLTLVNVKDFAALDAMCLHFDIEVTHPSLMFGALPSILEEGKTAACTYKLIDFTDMIWLPIALNLTLPKYDFILVDETQDLNACQLELVMKMCGEKSRVVFVGDRCQPAGTMVEVVRQPGNKWHSATTELVPIEGLTVGDEVSAYAIAEGRVYRQPVLGITERPYSGNLVTVSMENGRSSRYTPNHLCVVSFEAFRDSYCVYLMQKGNQFRVGMSIVTLGNGKQTGPVQRMQAEGADSLWILEFHQTRNEAYIREQAIAGKFGLPGLMFTPKNGAIEGLCEQAWEFIGDNSRNGLDCLSYFGRHLAHPLFSKDAESLMPLNSTSARSLKRTMITHASNLMTGCLMLPTEGNKVTRKDDWQPIAVSKGYYEGTVYSLDVAKHHTYIADGIVTHNCQAIMGFSGSDNHSVDKIIARTNATTLPLSICYRCPSSHIRLAQMVVPSIEPRPDAPEGEVIFASGEEDLQKMVQTGDLVICRLTAPLIKECIRLIKNKVSAKVRGRDIGKDLVSLLKKVAKMEGFEYAKVVAFLEEFRKGQEEFLRQRDADESMIESLNDRVSCLQVCAENFLSAKSIDELAAEIEALFDDNRPAVWLSTVHRAKGLEADRVFILRPDKLPLRWKNQQAWQYSQEINLLYVALTRAKKTLIFLGELPDPCQKEEVLHPEAEALEAAQDVFALDMEPSEGFAIADDPMAPAWNACYSCGSALETSAEQENGACAFCMGWTAEYSMPTPPTVAEAVANLLSLATPPALPIAAVKAMDEAMSNLMELVHHKQALYMQDRIRAAADEVNRQWEIARGREAAQPASAPTHRCPHCAVALQEWEGWQMLPGLLCPACGTAFDQEGNQLSDSLQPWACPICGETGKGRCPNHGTASRAHELDARGRNEYDNSIDPITSREEAISRLIQEAREEETAAERSDEEHLGRAPEIAVVPEYDPEERPFGMKPGEGRRY